MGKPRIRVSGDSIPVDFKILLDNFPAVRQLMNYEKIKIRKSDRCIIMDNIHVLSTMPEDININMPSDNIYQRRVFLAVFDDGDTCGYDCPMKINHISLDDGIPEKHEDGEKFGFYISRIRGSVDNLKYIVAININGSGPQYRNNGYVTRQIIIYLADDNINWDKLRKRIIKSLKDEEPNNSQLAMTAFFLGVDLIPTKSNKR